jgi:spore coat polysaccharide biosynthesis protein SpsF
MKTVAVIEARMASTRLPGKVLRPILGRPMLALLIERVSAASLVHQIVVATTTNPGDDAIQALAETLGVGCYRGSEEDVLNRVLETAQKFSADLIVEITGDCPLADPGVIDSVISAFQAHTCDYASNIMKRTFPRGLDVQVFPTRVLEEVARLTDDPVDHEHVSLYMYEHPDRFSLLNVESTLDPAWWDLRLTVDTAEDLQLVTEIFARLYPGKALFSLEEVIRLLTGDPQLLEINAHISQKKVR